MDCYWTYTSSIFGVELFFVFRKVIENGIWDTSSIDYSVTIQSQCIISLEAIVPIESIELNDCLWNWTIRMDKLNMSIIIEKVLLDLHSLRNTFGISDSSDSLEPLSAISPLSGRIESARLTLFRLFSEFDFWTVILG